MDEDGTEVVSDVEGGTKCGAEEGTEGGAEREAEAGTEGGTVEVVEGDAVTARRPVWKSAETTREVTSRVWVLSMSKSCTHIPSNGPPIPAPDPVPAPVPTPIPVPIPVTVPDTTGGSIGATIAYIRVIVRSGGMTLSLPSLD